MLFLGIYSLAGQSGKYIEVIIIATQSFSAKYLESAGEIDG